MIACCKTSFSILFLLSLVVVQVQGQLVESERLVEYHKRNYSWPPSHYVPDTPGWRAVMGERFAQIAEMEEPGERYEGYMQTISAALVAPNFTEYGFGLARCPDDLIEALQKGIHDGLANPREEKRNKCIDAPSPPWFIHRPDLTARVVRELQSFAEEWSGIPLKPYGAYGFRLYRNESKLYMHVDRMQTHIISFILHIDSSEDAEPWPIFIEDFHGRTHEVILTPGDILFYESSKCFHGRPRRLNGSWYSSVFVHFYPRDGWDTVNHELDSHYRIPPIWADDPSEEREHEELVMVTTTMKEPNCPDDWCRTKDTIKWSGPGEKGFLITPTFEKIPFHPGSTDSMTAKE